MIKWQTTLSYNYKIGGILIENSIKRWNGSFFVGLGLNVNQINFVNLPKALHTAVICNAEFYKDEIMYEIVEKMKESVSLMNRPVFLKRGSNRLFKKGVVMAFKK
jgi:BirA family biotin operon repressor/biotin-[acetyl-CoA-carboxylase] ligase